MDGRTFDVVVVGGGGSGLAAAISAAQAGARVIVLEKGQHAGGTTGRSIGSITASGTRHQKAAGVDDTPSEHFADMDLFLTGPLAGRENLTLRRILVEEANATLEWLMALGLHFHGPILEPPHGKPRMHTVLPNSKAFPHMLLSACRRLNVEVHVGAQVTDLIVADGHVQGVRVGEGGAVTDYRATDGVILATGDFSASSAYKTRHLPHVTHVDGFNALSTGDGHALGESFGVSILNGDIMWGPSLRFADGKKEGLLRRIPAWSWLGGFMRLMLGILPDRLLRPLIMRLMTASLAPEGSLLRAGAILVNNRGQRFSDERQTPSLDVPNQPDGKAYMVFDETVASQFETWPNFVSTAPGVGYAYVSDYRKAAGDLYRSASTPEELALSCGIPADQLVKTLRAYNQSAAVVAGDRPPVVSPPFHALGPLKSWVIITEGGLAVSERHEALDAEGRPIPGLFAVGSVGQGGLVLAGHGHHLGWAFTSGRRAGRFAAQASTVLRGYQR